MSHWVFIDKKEINEQIDWNKNHADSVLAITSSHKTNQDTRR
ncbi:hypothetical protein [Vibrio sp. 10N.247.310.17]